MARSELTCTWLRRLHSINTGLLGAQSRRSLLSFSIARTFCIVPCLARLLQLRPRAGTSKNAPPCRHLKASPSMLRAKT